MDQLQGNVVTYKSVDGGVLDEKIRERMLANFMAPKELQLKIGSQVINTRFCLNFLLTASR